VQSINTDGRIRQDKIRNPPHLEKFLRSEKMYNKYYTVSYKKYNEPVQHEHFTAEQHEEMIEFVFKLAHDDSTEYLKKVTTEELI
jgi:hypothetical protein